MVFRILGLLALRNSDVIPSKLALKVDDSLSGLKNVPPAKPTFLKKRSRGRKKTLKVV